MSPVERPKLLAEKDAINLMLALKMTPDVYTCFSIAQTSTTCRSVFIISGITDQRSTCKLSRALLPKECSGIQINKTLKKNTHLAPHMLLRVHCDVAAYSQKYVCFVTILMCMTPMTG